MPEVVCYVYRKREMTLKCDISLSNENVDPEHTPASCPIAHEYNRVWINLLVQKMLLSKKFSFFFFVTMLEIWHSTTVFCCCFFLTAIKKKKLLYNSLIKSNIANDISKKPRTKLPSRLWPCRQWLLHCKSVTSSANAAASVKSSFCHKVWSNRTTKNTNISTSGQSTVDF